MRSRPTLKAIDTNYNGYKFRSRTEARWAVFFDALGIKYEYEKEGYDLNGVWYLPDFWLPRLNVFFEVKGEMPTNDEMQKAVLLQSLSGKEVLIGIGAPDGSQQIMIPLEYTNDLYEDNLYYFAEDRRNENIFWICDDAGSGQALEGPACDKWPIVTKKIIDAINASKQSRFEK